MRKRTKQLLATVMSLAMVIASDFGIASAKSFDAQRIDTSLKTATVTDTSNLGEEHKSANGITTKDNGQMRKELSSQDLIPLMGQGWNYGNSLEARSVEPLDSAEKYETAWSAIPLTQKAIDGIKEYGVNTVRVPVAWSNMISDDGKYTIDDSYFNRVEEVINYCLNAEMYVIINIHWDGGWWGQFGSADEAIQDKAWARFESFWTQIANRYKEYSDRLIFESGNEELGDRLNDSLDSEGNPWVSGTSEGKEIKGVLTEDECYEMTLKINQKFVDIVRGTGGNNTYRHLLIAGYNTDYAMTADERYIMPKDIEENGNTKLSVSVHYYTPSTYCIAETATNSWGYTDTWGTEEDYAQMQELFNKLTRFTEAGYGVMIGEYGVCNTSKDGIPQFLAEVMRLGKELGYLPIMWDAGGFYDRTKCDFTYKDVAQVFIDATGVDKEAPADGEMTGIPESPFIEDESTMQVVATWKGVWERTDGSSGQYQQESCDPAMTVTSNAYFWQVFFTTDWSGMTQPAIRVTAGDDLVSKVCDLQLAYTKKVDGVWKNAANYQSDWQNKIIKLDASYLADYPYIMLSSNKPGATFVKIEILDAVKQEAPTTPTPAPNGTTTPPPNGTTTPPAITATASPEQANVVKAGVKYTVKDNGTAVVKAPEKKTSKSITIPATIKINGKSCKVTEIAKGAFKNNKKLTKVTIGKNVKKIGASAFEGCIKLKTVSIKSSNVTSVGKNAIKNINKKATITCPSKKVKAYKKLFSSKTGYKKTMKIKKA